MRGSYMIHKKLPHANSTLDGEKYYKVSSNKLLFHE